MNAVPKEKSGEFWSHVESIHFKSCCLPWSRIQEQTGKLTNVKKFSAI